MFVVFSADGVPWYRTSDEVEADYLAFLRWRFCRGKWSILKFFREAKKMKVMEFAIAEKKSGFCIDARNPYIWTDCGKITVQNDASEADVDRAKREAGIPDEALCVKAYEA